MGWGGTRTFFCSRADTDVMDTCATRNRCPYKKNHATDGRGEPSSIIEEDEDGDDDDDDDDDDPHDHDHDFHGCTSEGKVGAQASENRGVQASGRPTSARSRISHESITAPSSNLREHKLCGCCTAAQSTKCCIVALTWSLQNAGLRVVLKATRVSAVYAHQGIG